MLDKFTEAAVAHGGVMLLVIAIVFTVAQTTLLLVAHAFFVGGSVVYGTGAVPFVEGVGVLVALAGLNAVWLAATDWLMRAHHEGPITRALERERGMRVAYEAFHTHYTLILARPMTGAPEPAARDPWGALWREHAEITAKIAKLEQP